MNTEWSPRRKIINDKIEIDFVRPFTVACDSKNKNGIVRMLLAPQTANATKKNGPFEQVYDRKPNTVGNIIIITKPKKCLETDSTIELEPDDFPKTRTPQSL